MVYPLTAEKQREQLSAVLDYLTWTGISQRKIADEIGIDSTSISHLRSGKIKNIPESVIDTLHEVYNINPQYIIYGTQNMFDTAELRYENFIKFVNDWDLVKHETKDYLHFSMSEDFYTFLVNVYNLKELSSATDDVLKTADAFYNALKSRSDSKSSNNTLSSPDKKGHSKDYLTFSSDYELYQFVINVFSIKNDLSNSNVPKDMKTAFDKALKALKTEYPSSETIKKYVLIPAEDIQQIAQDNIPKRKALNEVIDILNIYPPIE